MWVASCCRRLARRSLLPPALFASLLDFGGLDTDADGNIFVDRNEKLFSVLLDSLRTSHRPQQRIISLWKFRLLEDAMDEVVARIMGRTCDADLSPYYRIIALEEKERRGCLVNVFEASLKRKDVAELQLPPFLLSAAGYRTLER